MDKQDAKDLSSGPPLVIDLDSALLRTDILWEAIVLFVRTRFLEIWRLPFWRIRGRDFFTARLAEHVSIDPATLPYRDSVLQFAERERANGRTLVLTSEHHGVFADRVRQHLAIFDDSCSSTELGRLLAAAGDDELGAMRRENRFDYIGSKGAGDSPWHRSRRAFHPDRLPSSMENTPIDGPERRAGANHTVAFLKASRPRQWLKNLLVFVPMVAGHEFSPANLLHSSLAFLIFSLCASSAYLLNDALDVADDRAHPTKRSRPIAAGALPIAAALVLSPLLAVLALALCVLFNPLLGMVALLYFSTTLGYSLYLKRIVMVDIVTLAILYSMRILGGGAATGIVPSFWLLAFSFFIFLSLALLKRHSELYNLEKAGKKKTAGRGYTTADRGPIGIMGINSAFLSVLIFILYFESRNAILQYDSPAWLAGIVPLLVFWLGRLWILSYRGEVNEDPVLYVSRDPVSLIVSGLSLALAIAASYSP